MPASNTILRREAIGRATRVAREQAIQRRERRAARLEDGYGQLAASVQVWLHEHADGQGRLTPETLAALDVFVASEAERLALTFSQSLTEGLTEAVLGGASVFTANERAAMSTLQQLLDYVAADGLQLSDRIWRVNAATRRTVLDTLRNAILRGASARQAADELLAKGATVPAETALAARAAQAASLATDVEHALMTGTGNPMRNALRLMRTEINRAYTESFVASSHEAADVAAVKFNLSPLHPRTDVCDMYAAANLHGLGPGVYPRGNHPYPAHPETLSYLTVVFVDEITDADRAGQEAALDWLRAQPHATQAAVLGQHKAAALRAGELQAADLNANWRDIKHRIGDQAP